MLPKADEDGKDEPHDAQRSQGREDLGAGISHNGEPCRAGLPPLVGEEDGREEQDGATEEQEGHEVGPSHQDVEGKLRVWIFGPRPARVFQVAVLDLLVEAHRLDLDAQEGHEEEDDDQGRDGFSWVLLEVPGPEADEYHGCELSRD